MCSSRLARVALIVVSVGASACIFDGGSSSTTIITTTDAGNDSPDGGFDDGQEGLDAGELGECFGYLEACEQDPYCACYLECVVEQLDSAAGGTDCLARCNLAQIPYWADQFLVCFAADSDVIEVD